jgi:ribosomal protein L39E
MNSLTKNIIFTFILFININANEFKNYQQIENQEFLKYQNGVQSEGLNNNQNCERVSSSRQDNNTSGINLLKVTTFIPKYVAKKTYEHVTDNLLESLMDRIFNPIIDNNINNTKLKLFKYLRNNPQYISYITTKIEVQINKNPKYKKKGNILLKEIIEQTHNIIYEKKYN